MPTSSIGEGAIKISCIQTVPGYETDVQFELEEACKTIPTIERSVFFKGLGSFDIIAIYNTVDFGTNLRQHGPIKHIIKSNVLLCYPYLKKDIESIFNLLENKLFTCLSFLKINPGLKHTDPQIDKRIREHITGPNETLLGSLGWNELIRLHSSNNIYDICKHISSTTSICLQTPDQIISAILKTLSIIGINYNVLPSKEIINKSFTAVKNHLKSNHLNIPLNTPEDKSLFIDIEVSAKAIYLSEIKDYFIAKGFDCFTLVGKHDFSAKVKKEVRWDHLLTTILHFRHKFKKKIFSTHTRISFQELHTIDKDIKDVSLPKKFHDFDYHDLHMVFNKEMASYLANFFYTLNSLLQNPLTGSIYADMSRYPMYIEKKGKEYRDRTRGKNSDAFALVSGYLIRRGAEIRSLGTNDTIEESTGRFAEFKGGCQVSLLALDLLPTLIMEKLSAVYRYVDLKWKGFITVSGEPKFIHINQVINVRPKALWDPTYWWALYHEIGHIIVEEIEPLVSKTYRPSIKSYLASRNEYAKHELYELYAEVIGYELGFFGDLELFLNLLWNLLVELKKYEKITIEEYAIRSFFVEIYNNNFGSNPKTSKLRKKDFDNLDLLYEKFLTHMIKIEKIVDADIFGNSKYFIAAQNVSKFRDLYPIFKDLADDIRALKLRPHKKLLTSDNTISIRNKLFEGHIWWDKIADPQAVLYHILNAKKVNFNTKMATIISFWNHRSNLSVM
ncbi:hypothetical protein C4544_07565 [candidate division WS5 bacterium]|uniref:Uncharacterized protein n=1 Tax=candidate division WS5 bacterium TaxID=2093353 RepID=A0A419D9S1_9BACT|nr:MAG: hypothetical protein C4544_07565 [candidate division WS5 bacterium]